MPQAELLMVWNSLKQGSGMDFSRFSKEKLLPILIKRAVILFFILCLFTLILYATGIIREFADSTQLSILSFYVIPGIFLAVTSIAGMILTLKWLIKIRKFRYLLGFLAYLFLTVFSTISVLAVKFILTLTAGNGVN